MSINAIQDASRKIRSFESEVLEGQGSHAWDLYDSLVRLRAESLEVMSALAACMMDAEIGERARDLSQAVRELKLPELMRKKEEA